MHRPRVELAISRSRVRHPNHYTTEPRTSVCMSVSDVNKDLGLKAKDLDPKAKTKAQGLE